MKLKMGMRQGALSAAIFGAIMFALVSVDARVRDQVSELIGSTTSVAPLSSRVADLGDALWTAARHQSIENAPMVVFVFAATVLVLGMLRL